MKVEHVYDTPHLDGSGGLLATVVWSSHVDKRRKVPTGPATTFFTEAQESLQVGALRREKGTQIPAHFHLASQRVVKTTSEVLIVVKGMVRVFLYSPRREKVAERVLGEGDLVILSGGGHAFEFIEDTELLEVKQGPYSGRQQDKAEFTPVGAIEQEGSNVQADLH